MSAAVVASSTSSDHNIDENEHNEVTDPGMNGIAGSPAKGDMMNSTMNSNATSAVRHPPLGSDSNPVPQASLVKESDGQSTNPVYENKPQPQKRSIENGTVMYPVLSEATGDERGGSRLGSMGSIDSDPGRVNYTTSSATKEGDNGAEISLRKPDLTEPSNLPGHLAIPFPSNLRRILTEVATTGTSSWLPWKEDGNSQLTGGSDANHSSGHNTPQHSAFQRPQSHGINSHRNHQYHGSGSVRSSHKRARTSSSHSRRSTGSKHRQLHRPFYSRVGSGTTTATATVNVESGSNSVDPGGTARSPGQATTAGQQASSFHTTYQNGVHSRQLSNHRLADTGIGASQKRPLFLIRTQTNASSPSANIFSPGSVGSGRTSGSEHEDTSQYECDSEGTSATSNSEISFEHGRSSDRGGGGSASGNIRTSEGRPSLRKRRGLALQKGDAGSLSLTSVAKQVTGELPYNCLKEAFRSALNLVLDHFYKNRGGYKLSPAEIRMNAGFSTDLTASSADDIKQRSYDGLGDTKISSIYTMRMMEDGDDDKKKLFRGEMMREEVTANGMLNHVDYLERGGDSKQLRLLQREEVVFQRRKQRLLDMLRQVSGSYSKPAASQHSSATGGLILSSEENGPPFTIQRVAEVLVAPERYYTQTHKLCNCLEKLLLVTSSASVFGGSTGGDTSQSRREEAELAALSEERDRLRSEFRQSHRRARRKTGSPLSDDAEATRGLMETSQIKKEPSSERLSHSTISIEGGGIGRGDEDEEDSQLQGLASLDEAMSRELLEAAARASLRTKFDHVGIDPHSSAAINSREARSMAENRGMTNSPPPPSLGLSVNSGIVLPGGHSGLLRQHNHGSPSSSPTSPDKDFASALTRTPSPIFNGTGCDGSSPPMAPIHASHANIQLLQMHHTAAMAGVSPYHLMALNASVSGVAVLGAVSAMKDVDAESRSSASSDLDSESDFDDSASDRSDGSDSGQHYEPLTAARAMALNRMQQQQRLQSRVLTSLQMHGGGGEVFRPPADSEYQSGDSIDSTRAEDSGGSDSSSSDLAD